MVNKIVSLIVIFFILIYAASSYADYCQGTWRDGCASGTSVNGTSDHSELNNLDYASSGHTGFQPTTNMEAYLNSVSTAPGLLGDGTVGSPLQVDATVYGGTVSGTGNAGYITRWGTSTMLADSAIYQNGSNIGIGTSQPTQVLEVNGAARIGGSGASSFGGNVGVGTTSPSAGLQVGTGAGSVSGVPLTTSSALVKGNLEVDGKIYGDGSGLTNIPAGSGTVTSVTASLPLSSSGGTTPNLTITQASAGANGYLSSADWSTFNGKQPAGSYLTSESDTLQTVTGRGASSTNNIGLGTTAPATTLQVGTGAKALSATLPSGSALVKGNLEVDGKIYGDGSGLTNVSGGAVGANPTASIGLTAVNGSASTFTRSDGAPALSQSIAPTWTGIHTFNNGTYSALFTGGNVGIGSATPGHKLDIDGTVYLTGNIGIGTTIPRTRLEINRGATIITNSNPQVLIKGNLEVDGKIYGDGSSMIGIDTTSGDITGSLTANKLVKATGTSTVSTDTGIYHVGTNIGIGTATPQGILDIVYPQGSAANRKMIITRAGNIGIGTVTPNGTLEIQKTAQPILLVSSAGNTDGDYLSITSVGNVGIGTSAPAALLDVNRKMMVLSGGNVGIGTTAPVGLLDVNRKLTVLSGGNVGIGSVTPQGRLDIGTGSYYGDGSHLTGVTISWPNVTTTASGYQAGNTETLKQSNNNYNGYQSGYSGTADATYNDASGIYSLYINVDGDFNTCHGEESCKLTTTSHNTANGEASQYYGAGTENTSSGAWSMQGAGTYPGSYNQCDGAWCMLNIYSNDKDSCDGYKCLYTASSGGYNRGGGAFSLYYLSDGTYNFAGGFESGMYIADGVNANSSSDYGVFLGAKTRANASTDTNFYVLGSSAIGLGSNTGSIGDSNITKHVFNAGNVGIGSTSPRQKLDIVGSVYVSSDVSALTFTDRTPGYTGNALEAISTIKTDGKGNIDHATLPDFVKVHRDGQDERSIGAMVTLLTKAVQELKEENEAIKAQVESDWIRQFNNYVKEMYGNITGTK